MPYQEPSLYWVLILISDLIVVTLVGYTVYAKYQPTVCNSGQTVFFISFGLLFLFGIDHITSGWLTMALVEWLIVIMMVASGCLHIWYHNSLASPPTDDAT